MWKYEQGTPCPALAQHTDIFSPPVFVDKQQPAPAPAPAPASAAAAPRSGHANMMDDVFDDYNENTTRNISKLMRDEFKNARLGMPQKPRRKHAHAIGVFEDAGVAQQEKRQQEKRQQERAGSIAGNGLMGGAAIKARRPQKIKLETVKEDRQAGALIGARKSAGQNASTVDTNEESFAIEETSFQDDETTHAKLPKDARRRTIWMPSDDTTVLSIHPGAYDHTLRDDTICLPPQRSLNTRTPKPDSLQQRASALRQSMSVAPKRAPLKALAPTQPNASLYDRVKCTNGKENIPPGTAAFKDKSQKPFDKVDAKPLQPLVGTTDKRSPATRTSLLSQPTAASQARQSSLKKRSAPEPKEEPRRAKVAVTKDPRPRVVAESKPAPKLSEIKAAGRLALEKQANGRLSLERQANSRHSLERQENNRHSLERQAAEKPAPNRLIAPSVQPRINSNLSRYPVLPDDLVQPELYEDNWLSHQEVALTELINSVFQQADSTSFLPRDDVSVLRMRMLRSYQDPAVVTLHKRMKASLLYGALSMPKDSKDLPRLREDVGLRRQFLDLWVQTYSLDALQAAAEVIIGRSMTARPRDAASVAQSLGSTSGSTASGKERELRRFLLTFLIHHEDAADISAKHQPLSEDNVPRVGSPEWYWQRTVLHSLMLIYLLDTSKISGQVSSCLFQTNSIRKSSHSVLHAFTRMLIPWIGDIIRPLTHLDCTAVHTQQPLSEYSYQVTNLATDLRNGVLLTRFVELLLYPTSTTSFHKEHDETLTLSLPSGETLTSVFASSSDPSSWPLSQHLKFPALSRPQKIHNVSIALSALASVSASVTSAAIASTTADDIVDGHREKTLSLLWSLVSRWGTGLLVDWDELRTETVRFAGESAAFNAKIFLEAENEGGVLTNIPDEAEQAALLKSWVQSICARQNITVANLTTSFSEGVVLETLISAYADVLPPLPSSSKVKVGRSPTANALGALGCSASFIQLFASTTTIPARSTTTALLAFLASRLLPLARASRAAKTLQRTWRLFAAKRRVSQRIVLMRVARECKEAVRIRRDVLGPVVLLQRTWRGILRARKEKADFEVGEFQRCARGWLSRKDLEKRSRFGFVGGGGGSWFGTTTAAFGGVGYGNSAFVAGGGGAGGRRRTRVMGGW